MPDNEENDSEQIALMKRMVDLSIQRTEMSAERNYMNAERTLSVWVRTALALMAFGIAMDRFGLILRHMPSRAGSLNPDTLSTWGGMALVCLGMVIALTTGARFLAYVAAYRRNHEVPTHHGPFLGPFFALCVSIFGTALLVLLMAFTK